jgi:hypothetical protein
MQGVQREFVVNNAVKVTQALQFTKILLDNQADISIVHPALLTDIYWAEKKIKVKRVGGLQFIVDQVGILEGFFQCM